jgi:hypothetical protein
MIITQAPYNSAPLQSSLSALGLTPPLMGFVRFRLSAGSLRVSTPRSPEAPFGRAEPSARSCSAFAVSHRPDGFLHPGAAGLLRPAAGHEVRRVSAACRQAHPRMSAQPASFPRRDSYPSKNSPRRQPYRVTAAVALMPLPLASHATSRPARLVEPKSLSAALPGTFRSRSARASRARPVPRWSRFPRSRGACVLPPQAEAWLGSRATPRRVASAVPGRRSDPFGLPSPHPAEAASGSGSPSPWPPRRSELVELHLRGPRPARSASHTRPAATEVVAGHGCTQCAASSTLGACSPRLGAAVAPKCPHTVRCASSLSRVSAGGSFATWAALLSPSAMPLAVTLRPPARAGLCFATSRPPGSSGSEDPHSSV